MIGIAHISDLHFGREVPEVREALLAELRVDPPELLAVSGDLTQRARPDEFRRARAFLERIPGTRIVVPGNHDMPAVAIGMRLAAPWYRWRRWFSPELEPMVEGPGFRALGINTARRAGWTLDWSRGRINAEQMQRAAEVLGAAGDRLRVIVAHHPFLLTGSAAGRGQAGRSAQAMPHLRRAHVDLVLGGHVHLAYSGTVEGIVVAQTGTSISSRLKGEPNSYNRIRADRDVITVEVRAWETGAFRELRKDRYRRTPAGWIAA